LSPAPGESWSGGQSRGHGKPRPRLSAGPYLVVGLARSGVAAALALRARGEEVIGADAGSAASTDLAAAAQRLSAASVEVHLDASGDGLAARAGTLIKSPGVPQDAPIVRAARARGTPVLGELELAWRLLDNEFIAVTGTNGKTTTTEWIGHVHREAGLPVAVAGNVGTALSSLVDEIAPPVTVVCEASSFQLEDTDYFSPEAAVLLNLAPDHLDRHGSFDAYVAAKLRIFVNQGNDDVAVAPDDLAVEDLGGCARRVTFGSAPDAELADRAGYLWWDERPLVAVDRIALPGTHNRQNAMATAAVCLARGIDADAVATGLQNFPGVPHRLEQIALRDGVRWVNDSKATNVASTIVALRSYPGGVRLIAGGRSKGQDFSPLAPVVAERCVAVYLIGEAAAELEAALAPAGVPLAQVGDLPHAVSAARAAAKPGETVLLSPACASFDQYPDFEARGEHFRALVESDVVQRGSDVGRAAADAARGGSDAARDGA
jgi:UDP-N-acetylmuramoylalanine--D-glutamate ligase